MPQPNTSRLSYHRAWFALLRGLASLPLRWLYRFRWRRFTPLGRPALIIANHTMDEDPVLVGVGLRDLGHCYFVASEHISRFGLSSKLIEHIFAPIYRTKSRTEANTVLQILRRIKAGASVCIFIEGERSLSGESVGFADSAAKLVRMANVPLITYRLSGGYLAHPSWARKGRRGPILGEVVRQYSPAELQGMSDQQINQAIYDDIYVNAEQLQEIAPKAYPGKRLAESLETALYYCPACQGISTLRSEDDRLYCACGLDLRINSYGYLSAADGGPAPFRTVLRWDRWQRAHLATQLAGWPEQRPITTDDDLMLSLFIPRQRNQQLGLGSCSISPQGLHFQFATGEQQHFPLAQIINLAAHGTRIVSFTLAGGASYELRSPRPFSAAKYQHIYRLLKQGPDSQQLAGAGPYMLGNPSNS